MSETTLENILASATLLFARKGVAGVTIQEIADHAGVAAGTVIYHFKSKNNLLFILARDTLRRLHLSASEGISGAATPLEAVHAFMDSFFSFAAMNRDRLVFFSRLDPFTTLDLSIFPNADLSLMRKQYMALLESSLQKAARENPLLRIDVEKTALAIWAMLKGIAGLLCESQGAPDLRGEAKAMVSARLGFPSMATGRDGEPSTPGDVA